MFACHRENRMLHVIAAYAKQEKIIRVFHCCSGCSTREIEESTGFIAMETNAM